MDAAAALSHRVQALATALDDAGVPPERAAAILGSASAATLHALTLVALRSSRPQPGFNQVADSVAEEAAPALAA